MLRPSDVKKRFRVKVQQHMQLLKPDLYKKKLQVRFGTSASVLLAGATDEFLKMVFQLGASHYDATIRTLSSRPQQIGQRDLNTGILQNEQQLVAFVPKYIHSAKGHQFKENRINTDVLHRREDGGNKSHHRVQTALAPRAVQTSGVRLLEKSRRSTTAKKDAIEASTSCTKKSHPKTV